MLVNVWVRIRAATDEHAPGGSLGLRPEHRALFLLFPGRLAPSALTWTAWVLGLEPRRQPE
jgi:hypothetical protein